LRGLLCTVPQKHEEKMGYKIIDNLACGNRYTDIARIMHEVPEFFFGADLLITCADSGTVKECTGWPKTIAAKGIDAFFKFDALIIREEFLPSWVKIPFFFSGYDELYLVKNSDALTEFKVEYEEFFTTDGCNFEVSVPQEFWKLFKSANAIRFLADGAGLNYVCEPKLADRIESLPV
jgi:hypothetical protein